MAPLMSIAKFTSKFPLDNRGYQGNSNHHYLSLQKQTEGGPFLSPSGLPASDIFLNAYHVNHYSPHCGLRFTWCLQIMVFQNSSLFFLVPWRFSEAFNYCLHFGIHSKVTDFLSHPHFNTENLSAISTVPSGCFSIVCHFSLHNLGTSRLPSLQLNFYVNFTGLLNTISADVPWQSSPSSSWTLCLWYATLALTNIMLFKDRQFCYFS